MQLILDFPVGINLLSGILAVSVLTYLYGRKPARGIRSLRLLMASLAWWALFNAVELAVPDVAARVWLSKISYLGVAAASPAWVTFALDYRERLHGVYRWIRVVIWMPAVFILIAVFTNDWHHKVWISTLPSAAIGGRVIYQHGPALYVYAGMAYVMLLSGAILLVRTSFSDKSLHRRQSVLMAAAAVFPLVGNAGYILGLLPISGLDPTPILFIFSGAFISLAIRRYRLFDLLPVARERLFDVLADAVVILNHECLLADMNQAARRLLAPDMGDRKWLGADPQVLFPWMAPVFHALVQADTENPSEDKSVIECLENKRWYAARRTAMTDGSGHQAGYLLTLRDITVSKETELQLMEEKRLMEAARLVADEANLAKSVFLTNMSHEMRTPLMAISGYLNLLESGTLSPQQQRHSQEIGVASEALLSLVNEMLDLSRIEAGRMVLDRMPFRIDILMEECASLVAVRLLDRPVDLVFETRLETPMMVGDRGRVRQMILNLLGNAVKFTETGSIQMVLRTARAEEVPAVTEIPEVPQPVAGAPGAAPPVTGEPEAPSSVLWIALDVNDTGPGISEEVQPRLFEPFVQANSDVTRKYGGSGLGLAITLRIAEAMGGSVRLESWPGLGSAFTLVLPVSVISIPGEALCPLLGRRLLVRQGTLVKDLSELFSDAGSDESTRTPEAPVTAETPITEEAQVTTETPIAAEAQDTAETPIAAEAQVTTETPIAAEAQAPALQKAGATANPGEDSSEKSHVLVVEDTAANRKLLTLLLEHAGYRVTQASTGLEAVDLCGTEPPDLILMDIQMPVMDGLEATRFIRALEAGARHTPIVAMTANAMEGERQACLQAGMDDFLSKPVKPDMLRERVSHWIGR